MLLTGCKEFLYDYNIYSDNDPGLYSIAMESVIGSENSWITEVLRVEEDVYGRVLFAFIGYFIYGTNSDQEYILAIVIAQKTDSEFAYYYDSINAIATYFDQSGERLTLNLLESYFDEDVIEELKAKNDWNNPINDKLLFKTEVTRKKICDVHPRELRPNEYLLVGDANYNFTQCYGNDRNGYTLVSVLTELTDDRTGPDAVYLMIVNKDHELISPSAVMRVTDIFDYEAIKQFKEANGWSFENQDGS